MFRAVMDIIRLMKAGWILIRRDALLPKEFEEFYPTPLKLFGKITRIGSKNKDRRPGERVAMVLSGQGPAYVKFGQLLATRPDIVGFEMADDLSKLQDRMEPFSQKEAEAEIVKSFGAPVGELFLDFSHAIAAASIAQVHKATLKDGTKVAVKVLRPNIEAKAAREFRAFRRGAGIVQKLVPLTQRMEPVKFIDTLTASATIELDLRMEAGAASELKDNLAYTDKIYVPEIIWEYSSKRVLTLEWIDGIAATDFPALDAAGVDREALGTLIMQTFLRQAVTDGYFHADMHQGNLIIDAQGRLNLIDFGIMGRLDPATRNAFADIIFAFTQRDYVGAAKAHFRAGYVPADKDVNEFATALRAVGEPIFGRNSEDVDMSRVLKQLMDVTEVFGMRLRTELVMLQRTMVIVEGVARAFYPSINMWEVADPVVGTYINEELGPKAIFRDVKKSGSAAYHLVKQFPEFAAAAERAIGFIGEDGIKLSSETVNDLAAALKRRGKPKQNR